MCVVVAGGIGRNPQRRSQDCQRSLRIVPNIICPSIGVSSGGRAGSPAETANKRESAPGGTPAKPTGGTKTETTQEEEGAPGKEARTREPRQERARRSANDQEQAEGRRTETTQERELAQGRTHKDNATGARAATHKGAEGRNRPRAKSLANTKQRPTTESATEETAGTDAGNQTAGGNNPRRPPSQRGARGATGTGTGGRRNTTEPATRPPAKPGERGTERRRPTQPGRKRATGTTTRQQPEPATGGKARPRSDRARARAKERGTKNGNTPTATGPDHEGRERTPAGNTEMAKHRNPSDADTNDHDHGRLGRPSRDKERNRPEPAKEQTGRKEPKPREERWDNTGTSERKSGEPPRTDNGTANRNSPASAREASLFFFANGSGLAVEHWAGKAARVMV